MRTRLLALPFLAATALAVAGAQPAVQPVSTANPCAPHEIPVRGRGLDGGVGCHDPRQPEGPADMLAARAVYDGPRASADGAERLVALRRAQALKSAAESARAKTGATDYATAAGAVPGSGRTWVALGPSPLIVDDPKYPGGQGYGNDKVQGRVAALIADPKDPSGDTVYMGSAGGGVWKTTDAGETWRSIGDRLPSQATGALALADNGWLFVGLGEGNTGSNNYAGAGIVRSKDGGTTWSDLLPGVPAGIVTTGLAVSGNTVLLGTNRGLYRSADLGDSFTRVTLPTGGSGESDKAFGNFVTDVDFQPGSDDNALLAVGWRSGGIGAAAGLYKTTDGGATWTKSNGAGFGSASTSTDPIGRVTLSYDLRDGHEDTVWAVVQDAGKLNNEPFPVDIAVAAQANTNNLNGVYRSGDNGTTWTLQATHQDLVAAPGSGISTTAAPFNGNYGAGVQAWYNQYVAVDPSAPDGTERVILGLEEIYQGTLVAAGAVAAPKSTGWRTIGRYWNACVQAVLVQLPCGQLGVPTYTGYTTHADQHAATFAKTESGWRLYAGNDGGVYKQDADAVTGYANDDWTSVNAGGVNTTQPYAAAMGRDGTVYLGMQDNGTGKIEPDGKAYEVIGGDGFDVAVDPDDSNIAYEEYANGILRVTQDGGVRWSGDVSPTAAAGQRFSTPFELDPTDSAHFIYAGHQVFEHEDAPSLSAATWTQVFDVRVPEAAPDAAVTAIDVHGTAAYAAWCGRPANPPAGSSACNTTTGDGQYDASLFKRGIATNVVKGCKRAKASTDCWRQVPATGLPNRMIQGVEIDPVDPMTVYVAVASYSRHWAYDPDAMQPGVIFRSTDGGVTFHDISGNLPQTFGSDALVVGERLLVATDVGVFGTLRSKPGQWVPFGVGIPDAVPAIEISTNPQQDKVVLATHGRGVWVLPLTGQGNTPPVVGKPPAGNPGAGPGSGPGTGPGRIPTTGLAGWVVLAAAVPLGGALVLRRRLRAARG